MLGAGPAISSSLSENRLEASATGTPQRRHVAVSQYYLSTFYKREDIDFQTRIGKLREFDVDGVEPTARSKEWLDEFCPKLKDAGLEIRSMYINGNLHDETKADAEVARLLEIVQAGQKYGVKWAVFNPTKKQGKNDDELMRQCRNSDRLAAAMSKYGVKLLFHYHTSELEFGAREFHCFMCNTNPEHVGLCLEQIWSIRGCGNSQQAMFDHIKLYGDRIEEVHFRQTKDQVLCESFEDGDFDNVRLAAALKNLKVYPHLLIEQSPDKATPKTMTTDDSIRRSVAYVRRTFG